MRLSTHSLGLLLVVASVVLAQNTAQTTRLPTLPTLTTQTQATNTGRTTNVPDAQGTSAVKSTSEVAQAVGNTQSTEAPASAARPTSSLSDFTVTAISTTGRSTTSSAASSAATDVGVSGVLGTDAPTLVGVGIPSAQIPDTAGAAFMQKSTLPDGTVFICVGALLAALGAAVLAWRGLVAWLLHRSVKRAAMAQSLADVKAMSAVPGKKRGMYNVVNANSNMSLDRLSAAPPGTSRPPKPFASNPGGTPPRSTPSLFFSPTAGGSTGLRDSSINRSSTYLPAGYYAATSAQAASGSPMTHVGIQSQTHLSTLSLATPGNRISARSGISPPASPSLPPSRGNDRAPPSRDGPFPYNRNSIATIGSLGPRNGIYGQEHGNPSQMSLNVPGGTTTAGGRAPSAYLEDLFENHGSGPEQPRYQT